MNSRILVVSPESPLQMELTYTLARPGRDIKIARQGTTALEWLADDAFDAVLLAPRLPDMLGADLAAEASSRGWNLKCIGFSAADDPDAPTLHASVSALLVLPRDWWRLELTVEFALRDRALQRACDAMIQEHAEGARLESLVARGPVMRALLAHARRIALSRKSILIHGAAGTGKTTLARAIHLASARAEQALAVLECDTMPSFHIAQMIHASASPRLDRDDPNACDVSWNEAGSLLIENVAALTRGNQNELVATMHRLGVSSSDRKPLSSAPRILATTPIPLEPLVRQGRVISELYDLIAQERADLPALSDRSLDDLAGLVCTVLSRLHADGLPLKTCTHDLLHWMSRQRWCDNMHGLESMLEQLVTTTAGPALRVADLPEAYRDTDSHWLLSESDWESPWNELSQTLVERIETEYLRRVLVLYSGRVSRSADHCQISRRALSEKLGRYQIDKSEFRQQAREGRRKQQGSQDSPTHPD